ncbi:MAG: tetratricopeptide repeat protein [Planctomycetota bacterium]
MPADRQFDPTVPRRGRRPLPPPAPPTRPAAASADEPTVPASTRRPPMPAHAPPATTAFGKFRVGDELGRGGMGTVRLAEDCELGRELAVKLLQHTDAGSVEQFIEEAQITSQLQHPNIVPVYELGRDAQGRPWLAMKRIEGQSLADRIAAWHRPGASRPDAATMLGIFLKVCDAVAFAHSRGVVHRDIKPANIMVGAYGEVLLVDWGLARPLDAEATSRPVRSSRRAGGTQLTIDGDIFGTPGYMPPEQADGRTDEIDERSDIFSLGGVLYAMLTGHAPYEGRNTTDTLSRAARRQLVPPRRRNPAARIPKELQAIVLKAMAADKADRYATADELQADLVAWQSYRPTTAWRSGLVGRAARWTRRHPTASLVGVLLMMATAGFAALLAELRASQETTRAEGALAQLAQERMRAAETSMVRLGDKVVDSLDARSRQDLATFDERWKAAHRQGLNDAAFGDSLSASDRREFLRALDALIDAYREVGAEVPWERFHDRAFVRHLIGDPRGAIDDCNAALRIQPDAVGTLINRSNAHLAIGERTAAIADLDEAVKLQPDNATAHANRAAVRCSDGDLDGALADCEAALAADPRHYSALSTRGIVKQLRGDFAGALADHNAALAIHWRSADLYVNRGTCYSEQRDWQHALQDFRAALEINPDSVEARTDVANMLVRLGDPEGARREYAEALRHDPTHIMTLMNRSAWLSQTGNINGAIDDLTTLLRAHPRHRPALTRRGICHSMAGRYAEAQTDLDAALAIDPADAESLSARGVVRVNLRNFAGADRDFAEAVRLDPQNWRVHANRAQLYVATNRAADAVASLQAAYRYCPDPATRDYFVTTIRQLGGTVPARDD